jgi:hypothetical protein
MALENSDAEPVSSVRASAPLAEMTKSPVGYAGYLNKLIGLRPQLAPATAI